MSYKLVFRQDRCGDALTGGKCLRRCTVVGSQGKKEEALQRQFEPAICASIIGTFGTLMIDAAPSPSQTFAYNADV
jgi:hypothetical protein